MKNILEVAKGYVARGFSVIPLEPKREKARFKIMEGIPRKKAHQSGT